MLCHHFAELLPHEGFVLPSVQRVIHGPLNVLRVREKDRTFADSKLGRVGQAVLTSPGIDGLEEDSMSIEDVPIGKLLNLGESFESSIDAGCERSVLKPPDDVRVFFTREIAQIAANPEITERIKCHGLDSRRYSA